jgi:hypothetical protein
MTVLISKLLHQTFLDDLLVFSLVVSGGEFSLLGDCLGSEVIHSRWVGIHFSSLNGVLGDCRWLKHESVHVSDTLDQLFLRSDCSIHLIHFISHSTEMLIHVLVDELGRQIHPNV